MCLHSAMLSLGSEQESQHFTPSTGSPTHRPSPQHQGPMGLLPLRPSVGSDPTRHSKWKEKEGTKAGCSLSCRSPFKPRSIVCLGVGLFSITRLQNAVHKSNVPFCTLNQHPPVPRSPAGTHPYVRLSTKRRDNKDVRKKKLIII